MRGDTSFELFSSGSTATSAGTAHAFFGIYQGLSTIHGDEVVNIQVSASPGTARLGLGATGALAPQNAKGARIDAPASLISLPAMRASYASRLHFISQDANNVDLHWVVWLRR